MDEKSIEKFALDWINAWNAHDISSIMEHYHDDIRFSSPFIKRLKVNDNGIINGKTDLQNYFEIALGKYPNLKFELIRHLTGLNSVVLYYKSINDLFSAECMQFNADGKIIRVTAHYATK